MRDESDGPTDRAGSLEEYPNKKLVLDYNPARNRWFIDQLFF